MRPMTTGSSLLGATMCENSCRRSDLTAFQIPDLLYWGDLPIDKRSEVPTDTPSR